jgi:hypothetical protein
MRRRAESQRTQLGGPDPALIALQHPTVCHGIATLGDGSATVGCKSGRAQLVRPRGARGSGV